MAWLTWDRGLALVGISLSLYFGIRGVVALTRKRKTQKQSVSSGSLGIQSGRDTKINP
jgi:hypothetical protein